MDPDTASGVWACPCLNVRVSCTVIGKAKAPFSKRVRLNTSSSLTIALPLWTRQEHEMGLDVVSCKICSMDVYASERSLSSTQSASYSLHALPTLPTSDVLLLSDTCIGEDDMQTRIQSPDYVPPLGIVLPRLSFASGQPRPLDTLHDLEQVWASLHLPSVPTRLTEDTLAASDAHTKKVEAASLDQLRVQYDQVQREVESAIRKAQKTMQSAISSAKEHVLSHAVVPVTSPAPMLSESTPVKPEVPALPADAEDAHEPAPTFTKRAPPPAADLSSSVGRLSASFARFGRTLPGHLEQHDAEEREERRAARAAHAAHHSPASETHAKHSTDKQETSSLELHPTRHDSDTGSVDDDVVPSSDGNDENPMFAIDEDLAHEAERLPPMPRKAKNHRVERLPRASEMSQRLTGAQGFSFSVLTEHSMQAARKHLDRAERIEQEYEIEQQGPYDLQMEDRSTSRPGARGAETERTHVPHDRYADEELALAGVLASNMPSHRNNQYAQLSSYRAAPSESHARSAPWKPARAVSIARPAHTTSDGVDREPKTSLPYKEKMMVPSLRKATRPSSQTMAPIVQRSFKPGSVTPSMARTSSASGAAPARTQTTSTGGGAPVSVRAPTAPVAGASVPPVPFVPSASARVSLGPESAPRAPATGWDAAPRLDAVHLDKMLYYMHYLQNLKLSKRTGWYHHGVPAPESIADHMYRMAMLAMLVDDTQLDMRKCVMMALVHDLAEAQVGDLTPMCQVDKQEKTRREHAAIEFLTRDLLADTPSAQQIRALWDEYEARETPEARLVKDLDCFELCLQTFEYEQAQGIRDLQQFWLGAIPKIHNPQIRAWATALLEKRRTLWQARGEPYDAPPTTAPET
ncbi:hypothetical protein MBRA1_001805 [Malassezia brasiliensis]|uniref:5'-deoxynucleotidase n=1 Tax=Malassezia brasiliensis TaxID=1821822 RepID=A0AAF0DSB3_9BASI|nr:hypothetical protein MBRA1_001805 [Malassezia brasiliensis]